MADSSTTPKNEKRTVSKAGEDSLRALEGPTPKNDVKTIAGHRNPFMSPTDAMTSPCTQQLLNHHRYPRRQTRPVPKSGLLGNTLPISKLANKENEMDKAEEKQMMNEVDTPVEQIDSAVTSS